MHRGLARSSTTCLTFRTSPRLTMRVY